MENVRNKLNPPNLSEKKKKKQVADAVSGIASSSSPCKIPRCIMKKMVSSLEIMEKVVVHVTNSYQIYIIMMHYV